MASGAVLDKMRQLYAKADAEAQRWAALQVRPRTQRASCRRRCRRLAAAAACGRPSSPPPVAPWLLHHFAASKDHSLQEQALSLLGTLANIAARLPALEDPAAYGALAALPAAAGGALQQRLLAKQLAAVEQLLGQLQEAVEGMQASRLG